jgi:hypothetical protein
MTANINFINLRSAQRTIVHESTWMGGELEGLSDGESDEHPHIAEARRLVGTLNRAGHEYIHREFLALKEFAIAERSVLTYSGPDPRLIVKRLLNGLHATARPIDGLIRRLGQTTTDTQLSMILRAGMVDILRSIDSIADELEPLLTGQAEVPAGEDFGVYDPGSD